MSPLDGDAWARANELFHQALDRPADQRDAFLDEACGDDQVLRAEIASLLAFHERAEGFLDRPASAGPETGRELGHYRIIRELGWGGMGVVYLAEDLRLGRTVALKALPPRFARDEARRERLRREARAAAALSHPGIAVVYALEEIDGQLYIAAEYVRGETLREELESGPLRGPLLMETALAIARALCAAHTRGVVHRDLKPENVIRARDGAVKILDFGLARFDEPASAGAPDAQPLTQAGVMLGTPAYMSPEQLRGLPVDWRSDVFAFGVLMYELSSGTHPFAGGDPASTIARILERDPVPLEAPSSSGPGVAQLAAVVARCLQKDPAARFRSPEALVAALEGNQEPFKNPEPAANPEPLANPEPVTRNPEPIWWWEFHQLAVSAVYASLLFPLWKTWTWLPGGPGAALFFVALVGAFLAGTLRLHLWFTSRFYPGELGDQRAASWPWIRLGDAAFAFALLAAGALTANDHAPVAVLLVGSAVAVFLAFIVIEPATARAAFRR